MVLCLHHAQLSNLRKFLCCCCVTKTLPELIGDYVEETSCNLSLRSQWDVSNLLVYIDDENLVGVVRETNTFSSGIIRSDEVYLYG